MPRPTSIGPALCPVFVVDLCDIDDGAFLLLRPLKTTGKRLADSDYCCCSSAFVGLVALHCALLPAGVVILTAILLT